MSTVRGRRASQARMAGALAALFLSACGGGGPSGQMASAAPDPAAPSPSRSVVYCRDGGVDLVMDLFLPDAGGHHPAVVQVHGGSWERGRRGLAGYRYLTPIVRGLLQRGIIVASIDYRLAPLSAFPAQIIDTTCAIRYLRAHAAALGLDSSRIGAMGQSAGAHLVSLAGLAGAGSGFDRGQWQEQPSGVQAVVDMWGPADLTTSDWGGLGSDVFQAVFGAPTGDTSGTLQRASPVHYVHPGAPPFLIIQGDRDFIVPPAQSLEFRDRLQAAGGRADLLVVENAGHELLPMSKAPLVPSPAEVEARVVDFFASVLT